MESILTSIKKLLGIEAEYQHFDADIIMHINSALMSLNQIGVGPAAGYTISDASSTWVDYLGDDKTLEGVKQYIYLKVRTIFDPPSSSFVMDAMDRVIKELEWRLCIAVDVPLITPEGDAESE